MATRRVEVTPANMQVAEFNIIGTAPYCQSKFSGPKKEAMMKDMRAGSTAKKNRKKEPKDFEKLFAEATYRDAETGNRGIPATAFRNACISACRLTGFAMTRAKLSVFTEADGYDESEFAPMVFFSKDTPDPAMCTIPSRNATGVVDIHPRPIWKPGWKASVRMRYDADQFTLEDVSNLMDRAGKQVGIGEGRPDSKSSAGLMWGLFELEKEPVPVTA